MLYSSSDEARVRKEPPSDVNSGRNEFRRDYARLLHSPAFRRLQGKTQLFPGDESDFFRNRLTHSLEVAQVAKGIALKLNESDLLFRKDPINTDLIEFAGLAHDLGHPPFGHNGEKALDDCMKSHGGFEGNAQTLRILARLEKKLYLDSEKDPCGISEGGKDRRLGLNLTFRTLASILKYDNKIPTKRVKKSALVKGYYGSESELVEKIKTNVGTPINKSLKFKTIECQIMDLADDIAYSTYDLEDSMKGGFSHPLALQAKLMANPNLVDRIFTKVKDEIKGVQKAEVYRALQDLFDLGSEAKDGNIPNDESQRDEALSAFDTSLQLASHGKLRVGFTSFLVNKFINGIRIEPIKGRDQRFSKLYLDRITHIEVESLKRLNYELMIMSPRLKIVEYRGYDLVKTIFEALESENGHLLLPEDYRQMHSRLKQVSQKKRLICDFVAGMTDRYAIEFYSRLTGSGASIFKPF